MKAKLTKNENDILQAWQEKPEMNTNDLSKILGIPLKRTELGIKRIKALGMNPSKFGMDKMAEKALIEASNNSEGTNLAHKEIIVSGS